MIRECEAVKKKGSHEKCKLPALEKLNLCGVHARSKNPTLWVHALKDTPIHKFQALFRGWTIRKYLKLCGPGVLKRSILANDEDLVSCESKDELYPIEFFSFEENGKIWWFDFDTIWSWSMRSEKPVNPYTKVPLTAETRKRLRLVWAYRVIHKMHVPKESTIFGERVQHRWNVMCQVFEDNGFGEISPSRFDSLTAKDYLLICDFVESDLRVSMKKTDVYFNLFTRYLVSLRFNYRFMNQLQFILQASNVLMSLVSLPKDPYIPAFTLLSALYRI